MKNKKKTLLTRSKAAMIIILSVLVYTGCKDDDEDVAPKVSCLECAGSTETLCEGDKDPDTGEVVTLELLELARDLSNAFGGDCRIVTK